MFEPTTLIIFISAAVLLLITPGPAVLYIIARSLEQGRLAGIISTLGIATASATHVLFAALGLSALLLQSALAFTIVKYLGAAYLIYLGIKTLLSKSEAHAVDISETRSLKRIFSQGFIVNLLNPKTALFFLAFLPQFVSSERGSVTTQILILGAIFVTLAIFSDGMYAIVAGSAGNWLTGNLRIAKLQKNIAGTIYILLGLTAAFSGGRGK
ncbi:MAG: LysE family translocator [Candidatus Promineifilaceae bacterium]|nr:LysE family translocator [Candidatus Promineifilaceae bacterium]